MCKYNAECLCDGCNANNGKLCTVRHERTCAACSARELNRCTHCTDSEKLSGMPAYTGAEEK